MSRTDNLPSAKLPLAGTEMLEVSVFGAPKKVPVSELPGGGGGFVWGTISGTITDQTDLTSYITGLGYITGINSGMVTTALGYTPYDAANPAGYITANIFNASGIITNNRTIDLDSYTFSIKKSTSTYFHLFNNGRVWIGSGTPSDPGIPFFVNGAGTFEGELRSNGGGFRLNRTGAEPYFVFHYSGTQMAQIRCTNTGIIKFTGGGGGGYKNISTGNIGIGTTIAGANLHIIGSGTGTSYTQIIEHTLNGAGSNPMMNSILIDLKTTTTWNDGAGSKILYRLSGTEVGNFGMRRFGNDTSAEFFIATKNSGSLAERLTIKPSGIVGIGTSNPNDSAILDLLSTTKGFLIPRMTTTQWNMVASKTEGLQAWDNIDHAQLWYDGIRTIGFRYNGTKFQGFDGTSWIDLN